MRTNDGITLVSTTPEAMVHELHSKSLTQAASDADFMAETAKRVYEQTGHRVDAASAHTFIRDLIAAGVMSNGEPFIDGPSVRDNNHGEQIDA